MTRFEPDGHVAPFTGAWIEILGKDGSIADYQVAPFTGAWIEICAGLSACPGRGVAPFTGAWIEINPDTEVITGRKSLPSRERGLKYRGHQARSARGCRSLHGSVD